MLNESEEVEEGEEALEEYEEGEEGEEDEDRFVQLSLEDFEDLTDEQLAQLEENVAASVVHGRSLVEPYYHERTHNIPAALIHLRSYHIPLLQTFTHFVTHTASALAIPISRPAALPTQRSMWTVIKSPFAQKKSQENFDRKTYKRAIKAWDTDPEVIERWIRYLENHAMAGVGMRVVRWERAPVGVGKKVSESVRAAMEAAKLGTSAEKVKALAGKIVKEELAAAHSQTTVEHRVLSEVQPEEAEDVAATPNVTVNANAESAVREKVVVKADKVAVEVEAESVPTVQATEVKAEPEAEKVEAVRAEEVKAEEVKATAVKPEEVKVETVKTEEVNVAEAEARPVKVAAVEAEQVRVDEPKAEAAQKSAPKGEESSS